MPAHRPKKVEIRVALPTRRTVGQMARAMTLVTDSFVTNEIPNRPVSVFSAYTTNC